MSHISSYELPFL